MTASITDSVAALLDRAAAIPCAQDLYSGAGTEFYERLVGPDRSEIREVLALARSAAGPVLDIAAGSGRLTIPLVRSGNQVTAVDLSEDMLMHLRGALPDHPALECIVADMRDFTLGRRYAFIVLGATSITLLDRADRSRLYTCVRRHLAPGGVFAMTVAGGLAGEGLRTSADRDIVVPGPAGDETYLFSQQIDADGAARLVNWVRSADISAGGTVPVLTSRLQVLSQETLARELVDAGFTEPAVTPVRAPAGADILLLTSSCAGSSTTEESRTEAPEAGDDDDRR